MELYWAVDFTRSNACLAELMIWEEFLRGERIDGKRTLAGFRVDNAAGDSCNESIPNYA